MKHILLVILLLLLVACGGNDSEPAASAGNNTSAADPAGNADIEASTPEPAEENADDATVEEVEPPETEESIEEESSSDEVDPEENVSGLPVNPDPIPKGEPFVIEGEIINASMIPVEEPHFLILGDNGVQYRVDSQPASEIFREDGSEIKPHEFVPGLRVRATAFFPADAGPADVATTDDLVILLDE